MRAFVLVVGLVLLAGTPAGSQERQTRDQDVLTPGTVPAPEHMGGSIILSFGQVSQVYFKHPFKSIRIADPYTVSATPQNDHIITFTGLAPGTSSVTLESADGKTTTTSTVTVVRSIHEVKIIIPPARDKTFDLIGRTNVTLDMRQVDGSAKASAEADYRSLLCNDIGCQPVPTASK